MWMYNWGLCSLDGMIQNKTPFNWQDYAHTDWVCSLLRLNITHYTVLPSLSATTKHYKYYGFRMFKLLSLSEDMMFLLEKT